MWNHVTIESFKVVFVKKSDRKIVQQLVSTNFIKKKCAKTSMVADLSGFYPDPVPTFEKTGSGPDLREKPGSGSYS